MTRPRRAQLINFLVAVMLDLQSISAVVLAARLLRIIMLVTRLRTRAAYVSPVRICARAQVFDACRAAAQCSGNGKRSLGQRKQAALRRGRF